MKNKVSTEVGLNLFLLIVIFISTLPMIWVVISSFKTEMEIFESAIALPRQLYYQNYIKALTVAPIPRFYINSILVSIASTFFSILFFSMSAYVLARFSFRLKGFLMLLFSIAMLIPKTALIFPLYQVVRSLSLLDTKTGLALVYTALGMPICIYVLRSYFLTIPKEIEESASLDGASFPRTFFQLILPLSVPGISTAAFMVFLFSWNDFLFALTLSTGYSSRTLPLALNYFNSQFVANYGPMFAATVMIFVPTLIVYFFLQEQVISGLTSGAVKG